MTSSKRSTDLSSDNAQHSGDDIDWILGKDSRQHSLNELAHFQQTLDQMLPQARRTARLFVPELDIDLLSRKPVVSALSGMVRISRFTRIQILFADSDPAVRAGHRLISLGQRFPSYIALRKLNNADKNSPAWMVLDETAILWRSNFRRYTDGYACCNHRSRAAVLCKDFDTLWEGSRPDPALRQLHI